MVADRLSIFESTLEARVGYPAMEHTPLIDPGLRLAPAVEALCRVLHIIRRAFPIWDNTRPGALYF
jgi:hypothetical protein